MPGIDDKIKAIFNAHGKLKAVMSFLALLFSYGKAKGYYYKEEGPK